METTEKTRMTLAEWQAEGKRLFGPDGANWRFRCPMCGYVATCREFVELGQDHQLAAQECIGRHMAGKSALRDSGKGPCDYAGYGLIKLSPVVIVTTDGKEHDCFAFAAVD